ncbi:unnamed protein product [Rhodiola kirilowii]
MVSRNDPGEAFINSLNAMLSPLELCFRKAAKDFECCWSGSMGLSDCKNGEVQGFFHKKRE